MKILHKPFLNASLLSLFLLITACTSQQKNTEAPPAAVTTTEVDLYWKPTDDIARLKKQLALESFRNVKVQIGHFKDQRNENPPNLIGENSYNPNETKAFVARTNVHDFLMANFKNTISNLGLHVVDHNADFVLDGEVLEYFVMEKQTYESRTRMMIRLTKGENVVWQESVLGKNKRFGRALQVDNYMSVLSDSLTNLVYNMLNNSSFKSALAQK